MPKAGKRFNIYGAFKSKADAKVAEKRHGGFIVVRTIKSSKRYVVLKKRGNK